MSESPKEFVGIASDDERAIGWLRARLDLAGGNFAAMTDAELRSVTSIIFAIHSAAQPLTAGSDVRHDIYLQTQKDYRNEK